jgi:hypothetical protein
LIEHIFGVGLLLAGGAKLQYHNTQSANELRTLPERRPAAGRAVSMQATRGWVMEKKLCIGSMVVAGLMLLLFLLDLIVAFPFGGGGFVVIDIIGLLASGILGYLAFSTWREVK